MHFSNTPIHLHNILSHLHRPLFYGDITQSLYSLTTHAQEAKKGTCFIARKGTTHDGIAFIEQAIANGASCVVTTHMGYECYKDMPCSFIVTEDVDNIMYQLIELFYPEMPSAIAAITGTNGKTSTAEFCRQLWTYMGHKAASIGTLGVNSESYHFPLTNTTPDPLVLRQQLHALSCQGITHVALEASSHSLVQGRIAHIPINCGAFTNITPDHLDYHKTFEQYLAAKTTLFTKFLQPKAKVVLNADSPYVHAFPYKEAVLYGKKGTHMQLLSTSPLDQGTKVHLRYNNIEYTYILPLIGNFQVMNALCALCITDAPLVYMERLAPVAGRLERIGSHSIYVDYAHVADGIAQALKALRPHTSGRLLVVFGGGGGRDPNTRGPMGRAAYTHADIIIITDDNPRFENPEHIRAAIVSQCPNAIEIADRRKAIAEALSMMKQGDTLLVAGKGPVDGQIIGGVTYPFNDKNIIMELMNNVDE